MHRISITLLCLLYLFTSLIPPITAQEADMEALVRSEALLDTFTQITIYPNDANSQEAMDQAFNYIVEMAELFSEFEEGTDISKVNQAAGQNPVKVQPQTFELVEFGLQHSEKFNQIFDISIGAISYPWKMASDKKTIPDPDVIEENLPLVDYQQVELDHQAQSIFLKKAGMRLDLGAIAKGYIADGIAKILKDKGINSAIINLGGNLVLIGAKATSQKAWKVGIQNPGKDTGSIVGSLPITDQTVVTSGIYERYVEVDGQPYHHILDPQTGYPLDNKLAAITIIANQSLLADTYSTIVFSMGLEKGLDFVNKEDELEAIFITKDNQIYLSQGIDDFQLLDDLYQIAN